MSVLSETEIRRRLKMAVSDSRSLVITPLLQQEAAFSTDSIDLRLGSHFLLPEVPPEPYFNPNQSHFSSRRVHVPLGEYFVLPAHQTVLGVTLEFIKLPYDVSGQILTKSSVARTFMVIETAPWVHPLYRGCLTLEIANVSNTPLLLYPGVPIGQLILFEVKDAVNPKLLRGTYLGPVFPEPPRLKAPREELGRIGIPRYKDPCSRKHWPRTLK